MAKFIVDEWLGEAKFNVRLTTCWSIRDEQVTANLVWDEILLEDRKYVLNS